MKLTFTIFLLVTFTATFQVGLGKAQVPVPVSYLDSLKWRQLAAEAGNLTAQFQLGQILDLGLIAEPNQKEAANWYTKAAEQGHVEAHTLGTNVLQWGRYSAGFETVLNMVRYRGQGWYPSRPV